MHALLTFLMTVNLLFAFMNSAAQNWPLAGLNFVAFAACFYSRSAFHSDSTGIDESKD